jgi:translation initiation factor 3 subunit L
MGSEDALPVYKELFLSAAPKFLSPIAPPYENDEHLQAWIAEGDNLDPYARHVEVFLAGVKASLSAPTMRSFLKLYTSIDAAKLASFLDEDEDAVLEKMMNLKSASRTYGYKEGSLLDGDRLNVGNLDFTINNVSLRFLRKQGATLIRNAGRRFRGRDEDKQAIRRVLHSVSIPFVSLWYALLLTLALLRNAEHAQRVLETIRSAPLPITRPGQANAASADAKQGQRGAPAARGGAGGRGGQPPRTGAPARTPWAR